MTRVIRAAAFAVAVLCLPALGGCAGIPVATVVLGAQAALAAASSTYCSSTTAQAKAAVRDRLTGGVPVIPCREAE
ncbi:hypothetical protein [Thalassobaculum sp.]|uniref:hypothetical protein n=1 Tax=Thalassobaculum sp. TaxID=2022740 RepID=UPI0032EAB305